MNDFVGSAGENASKQQDNSPSTAVDTNQTQPPSIPRSYKWHEPNSSDSSPSSSSASTVKVHQSTNMASSSNVTSARTTVPGGMNTAQRIFPTLQGLPSSSKYFMKKMDELFSSLFSAEEGKDTTIWNGIGGFTLPYIGVEKSIRALLQNPGIFSDVMDLQIYLERIIQQDGNTKVDLASEIPADRLEKLFVSLFPFSYFINISN